MKPKKILSTVLVFCMMLGLTVPVLADNDTTEVSFAGGASEAYTITAPASITVNGAASDVTVTGTWPSNRVLTVTCPDEVTLNCYLNGTNNPPTGDTKVADVNFDEMVIAGLNNSAITAQSASVSATIDGLDETKFFGTWFGNLQFVVSLNDAAADEPEAPTTRIVAGRTEAGLYKTGTEELAMSWDELKAAYPDAFATEGTIVGNGHTSYFPKTLAGDLVVSDEITKIGEWAFLWCEGLSGVYLPQSLTTIGQRVFNMCTGLTEITIPEGVTSTGEGAFAGCSALTSIALPEGVTEIGEWAFSSCVKLTEIFLPESLTTIGTGAFAGCSALTSIALPEGVTSIGKWAFQNCAKLNTINYTGSAERWNAITKGDYWNSGAPASCVINYNYSTDCPHAHTATDAGYAATCTVAGKTEGSHCSDCGQVLVAQTDIPASEHVAVNGGTADVHTKCSICETTISTEHAYTTTKNNNILTYTCDCGHSYTVASPGAL